MKFKKYKNIKNLASYAFRHKAVFVKSITTGVLSSVFTLLSLLLGAYLTGMAFSEKNPDEISRHFPLLLGLIIGKGIMSYLQMYFCHDMAYSVLEDLRKDLYDAIEKASPLNPIRYRTGDISSIMMEDVEIMENFFAHIFGDYIIAFICMSAYLIAYFFLSPTAALISFAASIVIATVPYWFGKINQIQGIKVREKLGQTNAGVVDTIQGLKEIIIFGREKKYIKKVMDDTEELGRMEVKDGFIKGAQAGIINLIMSVVLVGVIFIAGGMSSEKSLDTGISVMIVMAINIFLPVVMVSNTAGRLNMVAASADRIYTLLNEKPQISEVLKNSPALETNALLDINKVYFSYEKGEEVLKNISFSVNLGENIAITGASGAGKTTLINLMMRFYDPIGGALYFQGKNLRSIPPEEVRKNIAYVSQDVYLFRGSIIDNLRLGKPDASLKEVEEAAKIAIAHDFIKELPKGYDSFVGERGLTLSGGQKQRIAIARALITGAPILIMDEAVSNLDTENEELFRQALNNIRKEKTVITIAHRPSTIMEADRVIVLDKGEKIFDFGADEWKRTFLG